MLGNPAPFNVAPAVWEGGQLLGESQKKVTFVAFLRC